MPQAPSTKQTHNESEACMSDLLTFKAMLMISPYLSGPGRHSLIRVSDLHK